MTRRSKAALLTLLLGSAATAGSRAATLPNAPPGWEPAPVPRGVTAMYRRRAADGTSHEVITAQVGKFSSTLDDFRRQNLRALTGGPSTHIRFDRRERICNNLDAWEIAYTTPARLARDRGKTILNDIVTTVSDGRAYVAGYVRLLDDPERPEADRWIHKFCPR